MYLARIQVSDTRMSALLKYEVYKQHNIREKERNQIQSIPVEFLCKDKLRLRMTMKSTSTKG